MIPRNVIQPNDVNHQDSSCRTSFSNWCNPNFFKSVISVGDIFCPLTLKKPLWWAVTSGLAAGAVAIEVTTGAFSSAATYENLGLMVILYAVDPVVQSVNILTAKYPESLRNETEVNVNAREDQGVDDDGFVAIDLHDDNDEVAVVIPAHRSRDSIGATIRSCLKHVKPEQIFIIDNGNSEQPLDDTYQVVKSISERVNYVWGHIGNKTFAQYIGTLIASDYKYIYTSDDDMRMPENFSFGTDLIDETCKAVCYPIVAVHPEPNQSNILVRWQSLEYKLAGCAKLSQSRFGGVLYPHGAASMWDRDVFLEALAQHDAIFYAEDVKLGMALTRLGHQMKMAAGACLETEVPTTLFGSSPNLYEQRVRSWEMGRQFYFFKFAAQLFAVRPPTNSLIDAVFFKAAEAYTVYSNAVDWVRFPLFLLMLRNPSYWIRFAISIFAAEVPVLLWNYAKLPLSKRSDLQSGFLDIITFPFFKLLESALSVGGIGRLLSIYGPNYSHKPNIVEYEKNIINDRENLEHDVNTPVIASDAPQQSYKKIMYARFFQPIYDIGEIDRVFEESAHDVYVNASVASDEASLQVATTADEMNSQFEASAVSCGMVRMS